MASNTPHKHPVGGVPHQQYASEGAKIMIIIQRNEHGERVAEGYQQTSKRADPGRIRTIIKVNNLVLEQKELLRPLHGIDPRIFIEDTSFSVSCQLSMVLCLEDATDFGMNRGRYEHKLTGGIYTLNAVVRDRLQAGEGNGLKELLDEAEPGSPVNHHREDEITKRLHELYRTILSEADAIVCTPVVASMVADKKLFDPTVTIFDEAGMMPEVDSILVMQQFPACRHFFFVGDWVQGGIITMSDKVQTRQGSKAQVSMAQIYDLPKDGERMEHQ